MIRCKKYLPVGLWSYKRLLRRSIFRDTTSITFSSWTLELPLGFLLKYNYEALRPLLEIQHMMVHSWIATSEMSSTSLNFCYHSFCRIHRPNSSSVSYILQAYLVPQSLSNNFSCQHPYIFLAPVPSQYYFECHFLVLHRKHYLERNSTCHCWLWYLDEGEQSCCQNWLLRSICFHFTMVYLLSFDCSISPLTSYSSIVFV